MVDSSGNIYMTGGFSGTVTFGPGEPNQTVLTTTYSYDIFTAKYDSSGQLVWAKQAGGFSSEGGVDIAMDSSDNSYGTGRLVAMASFGLGEPGKVVLTAVGSNDIFVAKFEDGGVCGNGIVEGTEECDDGGTVSGDGCSATCETEPRRQRRRWGFQCQRQLYSGL